MLFRSAPKAWAILPRRHRRSSAPPSGRSLHENPRTQDIDVLIVGAGIVGASLAWRLADTTGTTGRVRLGDGQALRARLVVNAAGAWASEVGTLFGATPIGLRPESEPNRGRLKSG